MMMYQDYLESGLWLILRSLFGMPMLVSIATYVLTALALYTIAKRRGLKNAWLAWIPVADCWLLGSLSDQYQYVVNGQHKSRRKILLLFRILITIMWISLMGLLANLFFHAFGSILWGSMNDDQIFQILHQATNLLVLCLPLVGASIAYAVFRYMALYDIYKSLDQLCAVPRFEHSVQRHQAFLPVLQPEQGRRDAPQKATGAGCPQQQRLGRRAGGRTVKNTVIARSVTAVTDVAIRIPTRLSDDRHFQVENGLPHQSADWFAMTFFIIAGGHMDYCEYPSPVGTLYLTADEGGLTGIRMHPEKTEDHPVLSEAKAWLDSYFSGNPTEITFPLNPHGTAFRKQVWDILLTIPYGQTTTYGAIAREMAARMGKEKMSAQAVGQAVGANPISILVPCHRVVGANGKLTGYAGGLDKKEWLLRHEGWLR